MFENGNRPQAVIMAPGEIELDPGPSPIASASLVGAGFALRKVV
jgi:hypothetical protein